MGADRRRAPDPLPLFGRTGTPEGLAAQRDVDAAADDLIGQLRRLADKPSDRKDGKLTAEDVRFLAYLLIVDRARRGRPLAEGHLRLLAAALGIAGDATGACRAPAGALDWLGLPRAEDLGRFAAAAEVAAAEPAASVAAIARRAGVARATVRTWMASPAWARRVAAARSAGRSDGGGAWAGLFAAAADDDRWQ